MRCSHALRRKGALRNYGKPLHSGYRGGAGRQPGTSQPQEMQGTGSRWNESEARRNLSLPTQSTSALPVGTEDFFSTGEGQGLGGGHTQPPQPFAAVAQRPPCSKSYVWPPTLARLNPGQCQMERTGGQTDFERIGWVRVLHVCCSLVAKSCPNSLRPHGL